MSGQHAKPGDIIKIMWNWEGLEYTVIERPPEGTVEIHPGDAWGRIEGLDHPFVMREGYYIIVSQKNPLIGQDKDVDKSLKRQRDANLHSVFG